MSELELVELWQKERSNFHRDPIVEIVADFESWRRSREKTELVDTLLQALKGAVGALEFSRDYHRDLGNEEQAFTQDRLDAAVKAIAQAEGL